MQSDDLHRLRKFGNRAVHDDSPDLLPDEKPEIAHCAYRIAEFLLNEARKYDTASENQQVHRAVRSKL